MKGKLCVLWFILVYFWSDRSGVSVHRAGLRRGNGVTKLPCPLCLLEDVSRQEGGLCGHCRLHCTHTAGLCGLRLFTFVSITSSGALLRGKCHLADSTV